MIKNIYFTALRGLVWGSILLAMGSFLLYGAYLVGWHESHPLITSWVAMGISWWVANLCEDMFRLVIGGISNGL